MVNVVNNILTVTDIPKIVYTNNFLTSSLLSCNKDSAVFCKQFMQPMFHNCNTNITKKNRAKKIRKKKEKLLDMMNFKITT